MAIEKFGKGQNAGFMITGEHINWFAEVARLSALRLECLGIRMGHGVNVSAHYKKLLGLKPSHPKRFVFMYVNNAMYAQKAISEKLWKSNINILQTQLKD
jgi:hypothetical protein